jgi:hypothetical protein
MRRKARSRTLGLSAVEVSLLISLVGTFLAVFVPRFFAELSLRKTVEAETQLFEMHQRAAAYFGVMRDVDGRRIQWCLPAAAGPAPPTPSVEPVEASFVQPGMPGREVWEALAFQPPAARYMYSFVPEADGCGLRRDENVPLVTYVAEGDLDGDGILSLFELSAGVTVDGDLVRMGMVRSTRPSE